MNNVIQEILFQIQNNQISFQEGKRKIELLRNEKKYGYYLLRRNIKAVERVTEGSLKKCYILVNIIETTELEEKIKEQFAQGSNVFICLNNSVDLFIKENYIMMDFSDEMHFEKVQEYIHKMYSDYAIHVVYIAGDNEQKIMEFGVDINGLFMTLFAKYFAYPFVKMGIKYQIFYECKSQFTNASIKAIAALGNSINREVNSFVPQVIMINSSEDEKKLYDIICTEMRCKIENSLILYSDGKRFTYELQETLKTGDGTEKFSDGVYVIFGGMGGIGRQVLKSLAQNNNVRIFIVGRREKNVEIQEFISETSCYEGQISYLTCDLQDKEKLYCLFRSVKDLCGRVDFVIHSAGILEDCLVVNKSSESYKRVVKAKTLGTINLLNMADDFDVKRMIFFTSTSGVFGNEGQCDYAFANMFIDNLCNEGEQKDKLLSISWPLWDLDGMDMPEKHKKVLFDRYGMVPMPPTVGIAILKNMMQTTTGNQVVLFGAKDKLADFAQSAWSVINNNQSITEKNKDSDVSQSNQMEIKEKIKEHVSFVIEEVVGLEHGQLKYNQPIQNIGMDSVMISEAISKLESDFEGISKTLFFEHKTVDKIADYIVKSVGKKTLNNIFLIGNMCEKDSNCEENSEKIATESERKFHEDDCLSNMDTYEKYVEESACEDVAVVGVAGRYPMASNLDEFWDNLVNGKDCISEIPESRWNYEDYSQENGKEESWWKSSFKWGGFIDDIEKFDSLSFGIAPNDAKMMDPHQRVYAEIVWHALEDAGYNKNRLKNCQVGVYTGAMWSSYQLYGIEDAYNGEMKCYDSSLCSISNRISYLFDFHGPSMTLDTMCSSSLVAIHLACQNLIHGDIQMAVAGGVNLSLHPYKYIQLTKGGFLSKDGRCRAFGKDGSGYVPGEGVGAVILKKLEDAKRDNDYVYAVIKASSVNHNGNGIGYNVPDPVMQAKVIEDALVAAQINPRTISYIEAHGTGTAVGDPIEIAGLNRVFGHYGADKFCSIGSVKSNIGHLEAAAGIASLTKVLLQMKYRKIVPSLHTEILNPSLHLDQTPFTIQRNLQEWKADNGLIRAGISAFGAGGTNAHIILEEYEDNRVADASLNSSGYYVFALSANNKVILNHYLQSILKRIESAKEQNISNYEERLAYTLQLSRNHMSERIVTVYSNIDELIMRLKAYLSGKFDTNEILTGYVLRSQIDSKTVAIDESKKENADYLRDIAEEWINGADVCWEKLYVNKNISMVRLPYYPFEKHVYWLPKRKSQIYKFAQKIHIKDADLKESLLDIFKPVWLDSDEKITKDVSDKIGLFILNESSLKIYKEMDLQKRFKRLFYAVDNEIELYKGENIYVNSYKKGGYVLLCDYLKKENILLDIVFDLVDFSIDDDNCALPIGKVEFVQWLIKERSSEKLTYLHITKGICSGNSKRGIVFSSLIENLQGEYNNVVCRHIDYTYAAEFETVIENCFREIWENSNVVYEKDSRRVQSYTKLSLKKNKIRLFDESRAYVIVGGTRGIGSQIALSLVSKGVKKIALIGNSPMDTPEKRKFLVDIEDMGAKVLVYTKGLSDLEGLDAFFHKVKNDFGEIHTIFQCAGCYSKENLAFVYKTQKEIEHVLEPKVKGTENIFKATENMDIENIVFFSSISSISPLLAKGLSDYVAGNKFLNMISSYYMNNTSRRIVTILWPNWSGVGFGANETKDYIEMGMLSFGSEDGLHLLYDIIESGVDGLVIPIKHKADFEIDKLIGIKKKNECVPNLSVERSHAISFTIDNELEDKMKIIVSSVLGISENIINPEESFVSYGMDSIYLTEVIKRIEKEFTITVDPTLFLEFDNIRDICGQLHCLVPSKKSVENKKQGEKRVEVDGIHFIPKTMKFAIIGASCHFPGANNLSEFWRNLKGGVSSIKEVPISRFDISKIYSTIPREGKTIGKWAGIIDDIEYFDSEYFNITKEEAKYMDPIIRLSLENSIGALINAGYEKEDVRGKNVGVFLGARVGEFTHLFPPTIPGKITGVGQNFCAAYISQFLDIKGPSMVIDTACSSSLVSLKEACNHILLGDCDMAIVGGVDTIVTEKTFLLLSDALSPDGKCHTFDEKANGFVPGEGCGVIIVKSLEKAIEDGDQIAAVIEGIEVNNDGKTMGITTPSMQGQMDVIRRTINKSGVKPEEISYIEAHGTGTLIGDPIELKALSNVFREYTDEKQFCYVGSVKTNIGHLLSASGIASLIKVLLCMNNKILPPTLNCDTPNPRFKFESSPFRPILQKEDWKGINGKRISGISSFGFGGTNVHLILSDYENCNVRRITLDAPQFKKEYLWPVEKKQDNVDIINDDSYNEYGFIKI